MHTGSVARERPASAAMRQAIYAVYALPPEPAS